MSTGLPSQLAETDVNLVQAYIKANIGAALTIQRNDRDDTVTTAVPRSYFFYRFPQVYQTPAVLTVVDSIDFRQASMGANHVNAIVRMYIGVVVENPKEDYCTRMAWRYQAAMQQILANARLDSTAPNAVMALVVLSSATFSPIWTDTGKGEAIFRQEIGFQAEINHIENF